MNLHNADLPVRLASCPPGNRVDPQIRSAQVGLLPNLWEIAFPVSDGTLFTLFKSINGKDFGVVVHRFTSRESRFVIRGQLTSKIDLFKCLTAGEDLAKKLGCSKLVTQEKIPLDWFDAGSVFRACNYEVLDESFTFEGSFGPFARRINRIGKILLGSRAVPKHVRVTGLAEGLDHARDVLEREHLLDSFDFDCRLKPNSTKPISSEHSQIIWLGELLVGIILVAPIGHNNTYEIPVRYVVPAHRQTWANALLLFAAVKRGELAGAELIRFNANSQNHRETIRLAAQAGCVQIACSHRYGKDMT